MSPISPRYVPSYVMRRYGLLGLRENRGVGGASFQRSGQCGSARGRQSDAHDGAGAQGSWSRDLRIKSPDPKSFLTPSLFPQGVGAEI
jgi:hypothetical protein